MRLQKLQFDALLAKVLASIQLSTTDGIDVTICPDRPAEGKNLVVSSQSIVDRDCRRHADLRRYVEVLADRHQGMVNEMKGMSEGDGKNK